MAVRDGRAAGTVPRFVMAAMAAVAMATPVAAGAVVVLTVMPSATWLVCASLACSSCPLPGLVAIREGAKTTGQTAIAWLAEYRGASGYSLPVKVKVDVIGVGASAFDALAPSGRAGELGLTAVPVNVAERATATRNEGGYHRLRDQLWFGMRDWLLEDGALPPNALQEQELVAPQFRFDAQGRYKVESKDEVRERIHRSTDYADALALAIYDPPAGLGMLTWGSCGRAGARETAWFAREARCSGWVEASGGALVREISLGVPNAEASHTRHPEGRPQSP